MPDTPYSSSLANLTPNTSDKLNLNPIVSNTNSTMLYKFIFKILSDKTSSKIYALWALAKSTAYGLL